MKTSPIIVILTGIILSVTFFSCILAGLTEDVRLQHYQQQQQNVESASAGRCMCNESPSNEPQYPFG